VLLRWLNADPTVALHAGSVEEKQISGRGNSFVPGITAPKWLAAATWSQWARIVLV
jgi:hypothetical protein